MTPAGAETGARVVATSMSTTSVPGARPETIIKLPVGRSAQAATSTAIAKRAACAGAARRIRHCPTKALGHFTFSATRSNPCPRDRPTKVKISSLPKLFGMACGKSFGPRLPDCDHQTVEVRADDRAD